MLKIFCLGERDVGCMEEGGIIGSPHFKTGKYVKYLRDHLMSNYKKAGEIKEAAKVKRYDSVTSQ